MSFTIYWEKLDKRVAQSVQAQLNSFFAALEPRPAFLGKISVEDLDFGSVPPHLEIQDLTEPFPEFYLATEDDVATATTAATATAAATAAAAAAAVPDAYGGVDDSIAPPAGRLTPGRPLSRATVRSHLGARMDAIMRSGAMSPVPRVWSPAPPLPLLYQAPQAYSGHVSDRGSRPGSARALLPGEVAVERSEDDVQLLAKAEYRGDMTLVLRTELQLNYPAAQFVSLPVTMHITKIEFAAVAVVAYLRDRINFCFLEPDPPRTSLLDGFSIRTEIGDAGRHVLKNVEKLECFVTEQLRKAIDDELVFPSYHSFEMSAAADM
ncbi:Mitochondrial distribution and morphology protein 12 [Coemansia javaensis]|uniref:Mitochondrial distribution and morphology protein 12 n=1 Tax=Coemansia javaensis TaxID=2761396 RepID=A0A9W8LLR7_9FUNG|nr:Mitochondrial distribution and morphology protein 12 [Coemansia javaensis]